MLFFTLSPETLKTLFSSGPKECRLLIASEGYQPDHLSPGYQSSLSSTDQAEDPQGTLWFLSPFPKNEQVKKKQKVKKSEKSLKKVKSWKRWPCLHSNKALPSLLLPLLLHCTPEWGDVALFHPVGLRWGERTLHLLSSPAAWREPSSHPGEQGRRVMWDPCSAGAQFCKSLPKSHCTETQGMESFTLLWHLGLLGVHFGRNQRSHFSSTISS